MQVVNAVEEEAGHVLARLQKRNASIPRSLDIDFFRQRIQNDDLVQAAALLALTVEDHTAKYEVYVFIVADGIEPVAADHTALVTDELRLLQVPLARIIVEDF